MDLVAPARSPSKIVERPFTSSPHFIVLMVAAMLVVLLVSIWAIGTAVGQTIVPWLSFTGAMGISLLIGIAAIHYHLAKARAIEEKRREVKIFFGLAHLVLWEANEGVLFLKNKRVCDVIYGQTRGGGTAIIYPILGEERRIKNIPLTFRPCEFHDCMVLSRNGIQLQITLTFWWRILDERGLETFYLVVDREIHKATATDEEEVLIPVARSVDRLTRRLPDREPGSEHHAAEIWIRKIVESCTRNLVSGTTANLALEQLTTPKSDSSSTLSPNAPDLLSDKLQSMVQSEIARYGFYIDRIAIQNVQLPPDLQKEIHRLYQAKFIPVRSALEAEERFNKVKRRLEAVSGVIGVEGTAVKEILANLKNNYFFGGFPPMLDKLLAPFVAKLPDKSGLPEVLPVPDQATQPRVEVDDD
jgi:hypothetical protein